MPNKKNLKKHVVSAINAAKDLFDQNKKVTPKERFDFTESKELIRQQDVAYNNEHKPINQHESCAKYK